MRHWTRCGFLFFFFFAFAPFGVFAAESNPSRDHFLPASAAGWPGHAAQCDCNSDDAQVLPEYGLQSREDMTYSHGAESFDVALLHFKDPTGAYGAYSFLRRPDMLRADFTEHSSQSQDQAMALVGNLVLTVSGKIVSHYDKQTRALVADLGKRADGGLYPTLVQNLPASGFIDRSDRYVLGPRALNRSLPLAESDWVGFDAGAEAEVARYRVAGNELTLLLVDFPTPQTAQKKLSEWQQKFNVNGSKSAQATPVLFAKRSLTLLALVQGAKSQAEADILLRQVHSGTEVTWNEPPFELTQPNIGTIIIGTIIGTGIICGFALISGLAFGGFRLAVKRLLPDKVFDRSSQLQVLQLGLSSKPINAEDFYGLSRRQKK